MPENDLKLICDAIPVSSQGSVSSQANRILLGLSGDDVQFDINTGSQPTLFPPIVSVGVNAVTFTTDTQNGGFSVTTAGAIDNTPVSSPLTITPELDGKTLTVTSSCTNFVSSVVSQVLTYTPLPTGSVTWNFPADWPLQYPTTGTAPHTARMSHIILNLGSNLYFENPWNDTNYSAMCIARFDPQTQQWSYCNTIPRIFSKTSVTINTTNIERDAQDFRIGLLYGLTSDGLAWNNEGWTWSGVAFENVMPGLIQEALSGLGQSYWLSNGSTYQYSEPLSSLSWAGYAHTTDVIPSVTGFTRTRFISPDYYAKSQFFWCADDSTTQFILSPNDSFILLGGSLTITVASN